MATIGERISNVRKRRGLSQAELAAVSGVSVSLIRKLEQGNRADVRLETVRKLAVALRVPTTGLLTGPETYEGHIDDLWAPVRWALRGLGGRPDDPPTVEGITDAIGASMPLWKDDRYSRLSVVLPALLRDTDALVDADRSARPLRSRLLHLTGWLLTQTRQYDDADLALSRGLDDADDPLDAASIVSTRCWLLLRQSDLEQARQMATSWADDVEPRISRATPNELSAWGWLLLRMSAAAVRDNRPGEAEDAMRLARTAAVAMGRDMAPAEDFLRTFGPVTVAMKRTENAMIEDRPDKVLQLSRNIPTSGLKPTSNNRNRHLLDVASAHCRTHEQGAAFEILQRIRQDSPEWIVNQRYAKDLLNDIIGKRRTLTGDMRDLADFIRLEY
ncbi:helix-turn-helix domain-containing protein [Sphaerisporangium fuscum]|uniref:helix-turn-helix domain-containing protein n=1 Tax=Sphaerisporangium fuscum TaxID=2835868 RepID=UPI002029A3A0|nr:helix-turn-helix domain-containing protein [Sphaerisporangium fuscum]